MVDKNMQALAVLSKQLEENMDVPRELLKMMAEKIMSAEVNAVCGADYGERLNQLLDDLGLEGDTVTEDEGLE